MTTARTTPHSDQRGARTIEAASMPPSRRSTTGEASSMDKSISPFLRGSLRRRPAKASCGPHDTVPIRASIADPSPDPKTPVCPADCTPKRKDDVLTVTPGADGCADSRVEEEDAKGGETGSEGGATARSSTVTATSAAASSAFAAETVSRYS